MSNQESVQQKSWDPIWNKVFTENNWGKYPSESLIRFVARNYYNQERSEIRILEIGCGPGANIWYLSREGFQAFGLDGSSVAIAQAQERLDHEQLEATLLVGDILNIPYSDHYFDAIIDVECLYANSIENAKIILEEMQRVLKPQGKLYSRTFSERMFVGEKNDEKTFKTIKEGPIANKGFTRLMDRQDIQNLYSINFNIDSIDLEESTQNNGAITLSEYVIVASRG
ncbi:MAG: class I SAM-dependent methyltransferase [Bacteroidetes bacterium]|nr:class I SAM-dependent methyltransferase [Bacteroidota bacterium]